MTYKSIIAGALLSLIAVSPVLAAPLSFGPEGFARQPVAFSGGRLGAWELIGTREVSFRTERDFIPARGYDRHRQIMICVYRQPVRILDVDVRFSRGGSQDINVRNVIGEGQCTRAIDLRGRHRDIQAIALTYKSISGRFDDRFDWRGHRHDNRRFGQQALVKVFAR